MAVGFGTSPNSSWSSVDNTDWGSFYSDAIQESLLGFFTVNGVAVDPYDGAIFIGSHLDDLLDQLQAALNVVESHPAEWPLLEEGQRTRYFESCRKDGIPDLPPRDQALRTLHDAMRLATKAKTRNEFLLFCGD